MRESRRTFFLPIESLSFPKNGDENSCKALSTPPQILYARYNNRANMHNKTKQLSTFYYKGQRGSIDTVLSWQLTYPRKLEDFEKSLLVLLSNICVSVVARTMILKKKKNATRRTNHCIQITTIIIREFEPIVSAIPGTVDSYNDNKVLSQAVQVWYLYQSSQR